MTTTSDHVASAHKRGEETLEALYRGMDHFQNGGSVDELRESDPDLLEELELMETGLDPDSPDPLDSLMEYEDDWALSLDVERVVTIWLTFGGPNIYLEARLRGDEVYDVRHFAAWGSDRRETTVQEDSALWRYAERQAELAVMV